MPKKDKFLLFRIRCINFVKSNLLSKNVTAEEHFWTPGLVEVSYEFDSVPSSVRPSVRLFAMEDIKTGFSVFFNFLHEVT